MTSQTPTTTATTSRGRRKPRATTLLAASGLCAGVLGGAALMLAAPSGAEEPASSARLSGSTIVDVTGDAGNGFTIDRLDGTTEFPPTDSEARAECGEYDRKVRRVRCRTEVRQWYADLADMRDTIAYYQRLFD